MALVQDQELGWVQAMQGRTMEAQGRTTCRVWGRQVALATNHNHRGVLGHVPVGLVWGIRHQEERWLQATNHNRMCNCRLGSSNLAINRRQVGNCSLAQVQHLLGSRSTLLQMQQWRSFWKRSGMLKEKRQRSARCSWVGIIAWSRLCGEFLQSCQV